ncbi:MAG: DNA polymerase III subunit beta [Rikenellaceae bacterium]
MKFTVSSSALLSLLSSMGKVINSKNTLPILDYFLMELSAGELKVTTSDLETTLIGSMPIESVEAEGSVAAPAKLMLDSLKEFAEMPLLFEVNSDNWEITLNWKSGKLSIPGADAVSYPALQKMESEQRELTLSPELLVGGINKTIFATADDELRPVMNGIYFNVDGGEVTLVATDAHKMVKYTAKCQGDLQASFILPKKPASLLKSLLVKAQDDIKVTFDATNVIFELSSFTLVSRLIEGTYPNYNAVIPTSNPNKLLIDRVEFLNSIKRVAVCSNPTTNLIRMDISQDSVNVTAQDIDFSVSANEKVGCSYDGNPILIGFKSTFLAEMLSNIETATVVVELADSTRAGVFKPLYDEPQDSEVLMLLMPMIINS